MTPRRTPSPHPERGGEGAPDGGSAVTDTDAPYGAQGSRPLPRAARQNVLAGQRPVPVPGRRGDEEQPPPPSTPATQPKRFSPRNWRVRSRLVVLVMVPLVATVALAASRIATQVGQVRTYDHARTLAQTANPLGDLIDAMQDERDLTVQYMVASQQRSFDKTTLDQMQQAVGQAQSVTNASIAGITPAVDKINADTSYAAEMRQAISTAESRNTSLPAVRASMTASYGSPQKVFTQYNDILDSFVALHNFIDAGTSDESFINDARVLSTLTQLNETASELRGFVTMILTPGNSASTIDTIHASDNLKTLQGLIAQRDSLRQTFESQARNTPIWQLFTDTVTGMDKVNAESTLLEVTSILTQSNNAGTSPPRAVIAYSQLDALVDQYKDVRTAQVKTLTDRASKLSQDAQSSMYVNIGLIIAIVLLATLGTLLIARSLVRPLRVLQNTALEIAGNRLPEMVRRLRDAENGEAIEPIAPIALSSTDEVGQVARAFDEVHREAVRLATEQAMLRNNVNAMFVNLSRRSQSLVQRQLRLIDELENSEQDPDQLASLFKLDHLATRMRRNGENLLVLAGEEPGRRWSQPVPLLDVLRAAASEVEQYERVTLRDLPVVEAAGRTVNDLVHLVAELLENATSFSAPETKVTVTGNLLNTGGVMLEIEDSGIGMTPEELDDANERLANPPVVDVAISRRMGLFVVGRLATRHGIQVRLRRSATGGITALVLVPAALLAGNLVDAGRPGLATGRAQSELTDTGTQAAITSTGLPRRPGATRQDPQRALGTAGAPSGPLVDDAAPPPMSAPADTGLTERIPGDGDDGWDDLSPAAPPYRGSTPPGLAELLEQTEPMSTGMIPVIRDDMPPPTPMTVVDDDVPPGFGASPFDTDNPFDIPPPPAFSGAGATAAPAVDDAPPPPFGAPAAPPVPPAFQDAPSAFQDRPAPAGFPAPPNGPDSGIFDRPLQDTGSFPRPTPEPSPIEDLDPGIAAALDNSATFDFRPQAPAQPVQPEATLNFRVPAEAAPDSPVVPPNAPLAAPLPTGPDADDAPPPRRDLAASLNAGFDDLLPNLPPVEQTGEFPAYRSTFDAPSPYDDPAPAEPSAPFAATTPFGATPVAVPEPDDADDLLLPETTLTGLQPVTDATPDPRIAAAQPVPAAETPAAPAAPAQPEPYDPLTAPYERLFPEVSEPDSSPIFNAIESEWFRQRASARNEAAPALELPGAPVAEPVRPVVPGPRAEAAPAAAPAAPAAPFEPAASPAAPAAPIADSLIDTPAPAPAAGPADQVLADVTTAAAPTAVASSSPTDTAPESPAPAASEESKESMNNRDADSSGWHSPGDEGWRAAEAARKPVAAGLTPKGLPKRVPRSNLVPGSADGVGAAKASPMPIPERSAEAVRSRLASFHQGLRQGRDAASGQDSGSTPSSGPAAGTDSEPGKQD